MRLDFFQRVGDKLSLVSSVSIDLSACSVKRIQLPPMDYMPPLVGMEKGLLAVV